MKILIAHNFYGEFATGGEGNSAQADADLLSAHGHEVHFYKRTNNELMRGNLWKKICVPFSIIYSRETYREVTKILRVFKPDILHVHNYKYLFTPSIFQAAKDCGVKTVLTLHNYRLLCPCALFCCDGKVCEKCLKGFPCRVLWNSCVPYEHNFFQRMLQLYFYLGTSKKVALSDYLVDGFIALTPFMKERLIKKGTPSNRIYVRSNYIDIPESESQDTDRRFGAIYVGRLAPEKGVDFLVDAWRDIAYPLTIVGTGPLENELKRKASSNVRFTGLLRHNEMMKLLAQSSFLVFPSICFEGFPLTIIEAYSSKIPVVASDLGPRKDMIKNDETGLLFESLNAVSFRTQIQRLIDNPVLGRSMGLKANEFFLDNFTPAIAYQRLVDIYEDILSVTR